MRDYLVSQFNWVVKFFDKIVKIHLNRSQSDREENSRKPAVKTNWRHSGRQACCRTRDSKLELFWTPTTALMWFNLHEIKYNRDEISLDSTKMVFSNISCLLDWLAYCSGRHSEPIHWKQNNSLWLQNFVGVGIIRQFFSSSRTICKCRTVPT